LNVATALASPTSVHVIIFDRDQTLLRDCSVQLIEQYRLIMPELTAEDHFAYWRDKGHLVPADLYERREFWRSYYRSLVASKGGTIRQADQITEAFFTINTYYHCYPDTLPCLVGLRERGFRLAVLTDHPFDDLAGAFTHAGVDPSCFDVIMSSLPTRKPSPSAYRRVLAVLQVRAEECLFVDDEPENVRGAIAVGMQAVLIDRSGIHHEESLATVHRLDQLLP
jgi:HAD superfamily hydrolase (TIGR01509 family)